jgi:hypothetical protein
MLGTTKGAPVGLELGVLLGAGTDGLLDGSDDCILVGRVLGVLLRALESWKLGALVGADALLGGAESKMLGICDGWELESVLSASDFVGGEESKLVGF